MAVLLRVQPHGVHPALEQQQHAVHDAHDEVGGAAQGAHRGDVRRLDGLCRARVRGKQQQKKRDDERAFKD